MTLPAMMLPIMRHYVAEYGEITSLEFGEGTVSLTAVLKGMEQIPVSVECSDIRYFQDTRELKVGCMQANIEFVQKLLDR